MYKSPEAGRRMEKLKNGRKSSVAGAGHLGVESGVRQHMEQQELECVGFVDHVTV
jgi:hypothetical protein